MLNYWRCPNSSHAHTQSMYLAKEKEKKICTAFLSSCHRKLDKSIFPPSSSCFFYSAFAISLLTTCGCFTVWSRHILAPTHFYMSILWNNQGLEIEGVKKFQLCQMTGIEEDELFAWSQNLSGPNGETTRHVRGLTLSEASRPAHDERECSIDSYLTTFHTLYMLIGSGIVNTTRVTKMSEFWGHYDHFFYWSRIRDPIRARKTYWLSWLNLDN